MPTAPTRKTGLSATADSAPSRLAEVFSVSFSSPSYSSGQATNLDMNQDVFAAGVRIGMFVSGSGIPSGATVDAINGELIDISASTAGASSGAVTISKTPPAPIRKSS